MLTSNLYCHFPFCRTKCSYCALPSRGGVSAARRGDYVQALARAVTRFAAARGGAPLATLYFGGGSPALTDLTPVLRAVSPLLAADGSTEFTVELHPLDVTPATLATLKAGGVNRVSMGVQSANDAVLAAMGRGYTLDVAERAFARVREGFDNAGIDLIVGYPGESARVADEARRFASWGLRHCSAYSLILEEKSLLAHRPEAALRPDDDVTLDRLAALARVLGELGLARYEISSYAAPGYECRHNLAVWRGEDYAGLGEGAVGRLGLLRTRHAFAGLVLAGVAAPEVETVSPEADALERRIFRLRTREGLDATDRPDWLPTLDGFLREGLLTKRGLVYRLTPRGAEVCDSILAELV